MPTMNPYSGLDLKNPKDRIAASNPEAENIQRQQMEFQLRGEKPGWISSVEWDIAVHSAVNGTGPNADPGAILQRAIVIAREEKIADWKQARADGSANNEEGRGEENNPHTRNSLAHLLERSLEAGMTSIALASGKFRTRDVESAYAKALIAFHGNRNLADFAVAAAAANAGSVVNSSDKNPDGSIKTLGVNAERVNKALLDSNNQYIIEQINSGDTAAAAGSTYDATHLHQRGAASAINRRRHKAMSQTVNPAGQNPLPGDLNGLKLATANSDVKPAATLQQKPAVTNKPRHQTPAFGGVNGPSGPGTIPSS